MSQHTPGPWEVQSVFPDKSKGHTFDPSVCIVAHDDECLTYRVADIPDVVEPYDEQMANARLIAAAPMLLDTLLGVADFLMEYRHQTGDGALLDEVLATIRAAKGESNG